MEVTGNNYVRICGVVQKDPTVRYSQGGLCWASWTTMVENESGKGAKAYVSCKAFGEVAEEFEKLAKKGFFLIIEGHITTGSYNAKDGRKVYTTDVVAEKIDYSKGLEPSAEDIKATVPKGFEMLEDDPDFPF